MNGTQELDCFDCPHPAADHAPFRPECYQCYVDNPGSYGCRVAFFPATLSPRQERERTKEIAEAADLIEKGQRILARVAMYQPDKTPV